jgi:hypothetical protein
MMAIRKATRSISTAQHTPKPRPQPKPQHSPRHPKPTTKQRTHPHHLETELFDTLRQFNQAFGTALCALERIDTRFGGPRFGSPNIGRKTRAGLRHGLRKTIRDYSSRIGELRAQANRDLFRVLSGVEDPARKRN